MVYNAGEYNRRRLMMRNVVVLALLLAQEPAWDASKIKPCDRSCLTAVMDRYVEAFVRKNPSSVPAGPETRFTENTAQIDVGEGFLWKGKIEPTAFKIYVADPIAGQVALQTVLNIEDRPALVAIRLKVERGRILEIEHLIDRNVAPQAMELLKQTGLGAMLNMTTMETFGIRGGKIHEVEVFPFVTLPYGSNNGWTPGAGR
jgi:hypothetical protein